MPAKHPRTSTALAALLVLFALIASACGRSDSVETEEPQPTSAPDPAPEPTTGPDYGADGVVTDDGSGDGTTTDDGNDAAADGTRDDGDVGDEGDSGDNGIPVEGPVTVVVAIETSGGFVPVDTALSAFPQLVVMSNGAVYLPGAQIAVFPPPLTPALHLLQLTAEQLSDITRLLAQTTLLAAETDFGSPGITDAPTTTFTAFVDGVAIELAAYALDTDDAVSGPTQQARVDLRELIDAISAVVDGAIETGVLTEPLALAVRTFPGLSFQEDDRVRPWPIASLPTPQPGGTECVLLTGDELTTLWAAAADATTRTPWNIDGQAKAIALRPVFPHETICT